MARVQIVSDHQVVRTGLRGMLAAAEDLTVVAETSTEGARAEDEAQAAEVMLLDLGREGDAETLWRLGMADGTLPIVAIGQSAPEALVRQVLQAGARAYLLWDVTADELAGAVRAVLQGLIVLHPAAAAVLAGDSASRIEPSQAAEPLSPREREVLHLLAQGLPSKTIAARLHVSEHTVKFHIGSLMTKLGASSRTEAVTVALRRGLIAL